MISVRKDSYTIRCILTTSTQTTWCNESLPILATPIQSFLCNQRDRTHRLSLKCPSCSASRLPASLSSTLCGVQFLTVSRSRSKNPIAQWKETAPFGPVKQGQMLPEILGSMRCVISGQIIEKAIENPHHKGQNGNLLLDICLQEITVWMKCTI